MALNIISNFAANVAHRNLVSSDNAQTSSLAKLSAGTRVLSAKDDAASLAIGSRLRAEVSSLNTASQNASQASSLLQIADGALGTISDILVRMKALAVQSSSGQFSSTERTVLDNEFQALSKEITRVSQDTEFNGTQLINGGAAVFNADATGNAVKTQEVKTGALAAAGITVDYNTSILTAGSNDTFRLAFVKASGGAGTGAENLTLTNTRTGAVQIIDIETAFNAAAVAGGGTATDATLASGKTLDVNFSNLGVTVTLDSTFNRTTDIKPVALTGISGQGNITATNESFATPTTSFTNDAITALASAGGFSAATGLLSLTVATSGAGNATISGLAGVKFAVDGGAIGAAGAATADLDDGSGHTVHIYVTTAGAVDVKVGSYSFGSITAAAGGAGGTIVADLGNLSFGTNFTAGATEQNFSFKVGTGAKSFDSLAFTVKAASASVLKLDITDITTIAQADSALTAVTTAIDTVNNQRSTIGASQNRLSFAANNLASAIENNEAARSGLLDLDVAQEISTFTSKQILVQTGVAMLAQANQVPQNLLRLFQ